MPRKLALIIGNSQYEDARLSKLAAPDADARALADLLKTPGIGNFDDVTTLLNQGLAAVRKAIARFFDAKHRDDLLLLYFSGHGVRDDQGHLYLAVRDTEHDVLAGTAIEASYVTTRMDQSASKRLVLILDCCHSGAFGYGAKAVQGAAVGTATAFEGSGRGRVVLTATDSTQYAWEGDRVIGDVDNSLFTHYLIEGIKNGAADRDEDGNITIDELYDYVYDKVLNDTPKQTPGKWAFGQQGEIVIAHNPTVSRVKLPPEIEEALKSTLPSVRFQAMVELNGILRGRHEGRAQAAREVLHQLAGDDSRRVASGALILLQSIEAGERLSDEELLKRLREKEEEDKRMQTGRKTVAAQVAAFLSRADAALESGALDEVNALLAQAIQLDPQHPDIARLQESLADAIDERRRLEEAEQRIRELRQRIATLIARANAAARDDEAIALLGEALGLDPEHTEVKELLQARHRAKAEAEAAEQRAREQAAARERAEREAEEARRKAEERRRQGIDAQLAEASRHLALGNTTKAIVITDAILGLEPDHPAAKAKRADIERAVEAKQDAERRAAQERDRRRQIDDMIATAEAAATHDSALEILRQVLARDPGNSEAQRLVAKHLKDLEAARAEERARRLAAAQERIAEHLARKEFDRAEQLLAQAEREFETTREFRKLRDEVARRRRSEEVRQAEVARLEAERAARQAAEEARAAQQARAARDARAAGEARAAQEEAPVVQTLVTEELQTTSTTISPLFSTEARFATAVQWFQTKVLWSTTFKTTAALVLVLIVGWNVYRPAAPTPETKQADPPSVGGPVNPPAVVPPANTITPSPAVTNPPAGGVATEKAGKPKAEGKSVVARMPGAIDAERNARQHLESGDQAKAFKAVKAGLSVDPKDAPLRALLNQIIGDAQRDALKAEATARAAGAHAVATPEFHAAVGLVDLANGLPAAGPPEHVVTAFWQAKELFEKAARTPAPKAPPNPVDLSGGTGTAIKTDPPRTGEKPRETPPPMPTTKPADAKPDPPAKQLSDEESVRKAVEAYAAAFSTRQPVAVRAVYPEIPAREIQNLEKLRRDFQSYEMRITVTRIEVDGDRAKVQCRIFHNGISFSGKTIPQGGSDTLLFERRGATWVRIK